MVKSDSYDSPIALDFLLLKENCPNRKNENSAAHIGIKASDMAPATEMLQPAIFNSISSG